MRKSKLFMLILLLTLAWGCSGETETGTDTTESTTEIMDPGSEVIVPPEMPEEQEEPGEHGDISAVPLEIKGHHRLAYVSGGQIYLYDLDSDQVQELKFTYDGAAVAFSEDGNTLFYTVNEVEFYTLWKVELTESLQPVMIGNLEKPADQFTSQTYGEPARMVVKDGVLHAECAYEWGEFAFRSSFRMPLESEEISFHEDNKVYSIVYDQREAAQKMHAGLREQIVARGVGEHEWQELFFIKEGDSLRLTQTEDYREEDPYDEMGVDGWKMYEVSPDGKAIWFSMHTGMGDLGHGPAMLVNLDGTKQEELIDDVLGVVDGDPVWLPDSRLVYWNMEDLLIVEDRNNKSRGLAKGVGYFAVDPAWE